MLGGVGAGRVVVVVDVLVVVDVVPPDVPVVTGFGVTGLVSSVQPTRNRLRTNKAPANSFIT